MRGLVSFKVVTVTVTEALFGYFVFVCYAIRITSAIVHLKALSTPFTDAPASFAVGVNSSGICGALHLADPLDACSSLLNGFRYDDTPSIRFVLIVRGKCTFEDKIRNAQDGGFHAAVVYDDQDNRNLVSMIGNSEGIWVHAVFVSNVAGETLKKHARAEECECCIIPSLGETEWNVLVISVISLLVMVSVLAAFFFTRNRRRNQQGTSHQLDSKVVEVLPCVTFSTARLSSYTGETCAICLEDYKDGESLRLLPCHHEFHASCVDSWLTKWGTFCPVCKHNMSTEASYSEVSEQRPFLVF
uniref:RING-type domain-containing protein n=1 Tax=Davidia involucrata TaxID=16924 RepID=A0A5B7BSJ6_DAVIN